MYMNRWVDRDRGREKNAEIRLKYYFRSKGFFDDCEVHVSQSYRLRISMVERRERLKIHSET